MGRVATLLLILCCYCYTTKYSFPPFQVDTSTGEAEEDGVEDEYQIEDFDIVAADYMLRVGVSNFRNAWENMDLDSERIDEYGLGARESLAEAVSAVINILGMQPCEVSFYHSRLILLKVIIDSTLGHYVFLGPSAITNST
jgi:hypothetical protein